MQGLLITEEKIVVVVLNLKGVRVDLRSKESEEGLLYNLKDIELAWKKQGGKGKALDDWKRGKVFKELSELREFHVVSEEGVKGGTWANKVALLEYAGHCSATFRIQINKAFLAISEGRDQDAREIVGESLIDLEFANKVSERWKEYVKWSYSSFAEVNNRYGGNLTKMVIKSATGASTKNNIKGKVDAGLIERLVEQNNGAAILAINATLDIVKNAMKTSIFKKMMETRDGQKEAYKTLSELLDWSEEV